MGRLMGERLLQAWERIRVYREDEAALALLALAWPQRDADELARLPLGERNAMLLELRATSLGREIQGFAVCPECGAQLELAMDARELWETLRAQHQREMAGTAEYAMRPANTLDLLAARDARNEREAEAILLARTTGCDRDGGMDEKGAESLNARPEAERAALIQRFEEMNAAAEIRVEVECAECHACPALDFNVAQFFLRELASEARRLMDDVHWLATAYGWSERSITAMSAARRAAYLERVGA